MRSWEGDQSDRYGCTVSAFAFSVPSPKRDTQCSEVPADYIGRIRGRTCWSSL